MPIALPKGVEVIVQKDKVSVKGPKGTLSRALVPGISVVHEQDRVLVQASDDSRELSRMHGLYRALVSNMIQGVAQGFEKILEMVGVGYRAAIQGNTLDVQVGYSHPTKLEIPAGITVKVDKSTTITIHGCDRQAVGQFAAEIRCIRPPEPYQGKGIRYKDEYVRRKAGKAAKSVKKAA